MLLDRIIVPSLTDTNLQNTSRDPVLRMQGGRLTIFVTGNHGTRRFWTLVVKSLSFLLLYFLFGQLFFSHICLPQVQIPP